LLAIVLALRTKNVLLSLFGGVLLGLFFLQNFHFFASFIAFYELCVDLLSQAWILKTLAFALLVGSVMELLEKSGGIGGFVSYMQEKRKIIDSPKKALLLSYFIGVVIFIESSITSLIAGAVGRPFCDKYNIPHAKLAFVCDSTSAPVSSLIVLNGWGALLLGLIATQIESGLLQGDSVEILIESVLYNFYAMSALVVTFIAIYFGIDLGAMKHATREKKSFDVVVEKDVSPLFMILPIVFMVGSVFVFLYLTGDGNILHGSGSSSIFYTMIATLVFMYLLYVGRTPMKTATFVLAAFKGAKKLSSIVGVLFFAFAIGKVTNELQTGLYIASLAKGIVSASFVAVIIFLLSALISFSTGTSWGTFSIMIPIAVPMAVGLDADVALAIGAVISGGVFGDHCSPISDTTIISSLAADCDVVEHVNTQLPYALLSGCIAICAFFLFSLS